MLVTGASSGIGRSTVIKLLNEGHIVYGGARRVKLMETLNELGAFTMEMDVTKDSSVVSGIDRIIKEHSRIDVLINNAGYGSYGAIEDVEMAEAKHQFEVNVFGAARLTQLVLPHMRRNQYGRIINISSMGGKLVTPFGGWYHATKFAIEALSDALRLETRFFKDIKVIIIEPGFVSSEWLQIAIGSMLPESAAGDYGVPAQKTADFMRRKSRTASSPEIIAGIISRAIKSRNPRPRYVAGKDAKTFLFLKKILSDRMYDKILFKQINR
ncbi:MAG: oxidoreductase [Victivallales bacterium]|nr:oxidoreductase [Victivallales bacterium]